MMPLPDGLRAELARHGLIAPTMVEPERFWRFAGADKDRHNTAAWLKVRADGSAVFGDLSRDLSESWQPHREKALTRAELDVLKREAAEHRAQAEAARREAQARTAERAQRLWSEAQPADTGHPYLSAKGIPSHGLRQIRGTLLVPMRDATDGKLINLQWILPDGSKRFMRDGRTAGACWFCDGADFSETRPLLICEGVATAASLAQATGYSVVAALSSGNLQTVAQVTRRKFPAAKLVIAGDNDASGTGQRAALEAARAVKGLLAIPKGEGMDWNDVAAADGLEAVRAAIEGAREPCAASQDIPRSGDGALGPPAVTHERPRDTGDTPVCRTSRTVAAGPTPLLRPIPPPDPFPVDALGAILGPAARAIAEVVQCPAALAAGCVLATAALAAQKQANVQTLGGARPLSLFVLTIAGSGDRKTAADKVALAPVDEHVRRAHATYETESAEWERAREARKLDRTNARKAAESGDGYADALKEIVDEPKPRKPWIVCSEPTAEGLVKSLADGQYAQGIYTDEGGQFLGGHALTEEAELRTIAMLSRLWQGDRIDRVRATDSEHVILYGRRVSMHLLVQPDVATRMLGKPLYRSQGFLARWLIAAPDSLAGTRLHDPARTEADDDPRIRRFWHAIGELLAAPASEDREVGGLDPACLALSPEARSLLVEAYDEIERAQARDGMLEGVREWASKAAEHACRIAGVLTLAADPAAHAVSGETMGGALTLTQFYLSEYVRLVGSADVPEHIRHAHELLAWLRQKGRTTVTARDVMRLGPGRAIRHGDAAKAALKTLAEHGWLSTEDHKLYIADPAAFAGHAS